MIYHHNQLFSKLLSNSNNKRIQKLHAKVEKTKFEFFIIIIFHK